MGEGGGERQNSHYNLSTCRRNTRKLAYVCIHDISHYVVMYNTCACAHMPPTHPTADDTCSTCQLTAVTSCQRSENFALLWQFLAVSQIHVHLTTGQRELHVQVLVHTKRQVRTWSSVSRHCACVLTHKRHARCQRLLRNISTLTLVCLPSSQRLTSMHSGVMAEWHKIRACTCTTCGVYLSSSSDNRQDKAQTSVRISLWHFSQIITWVQHQGIEAKPRG